MSVELNRFRNTTQFLAPASRHSLPDGQYDIYPAHPVGPGKIKHGFSAIADVILSSRQHCTVIDGFVGVMWEYFRQNLDRVLRDRGIDANWYSVDDALKPPEEIRSLAALFLGGDDPLFGTRCNKALIDFFDQKRLRSLGQGSTTALTIVYGCGSALTEMQGFLIYVDVPKNEIQFRSRAGSIRNLGADKPEDPRSMYKRFYFVDWPVLNRHRAAILHQIDLIVDGQRPDDPTMMTGHDFRDGLDSLATTVIRVRPWFEPGPWGGQWIKTHLSQLSRDVPNYAWSFELISPENGVAFENDGLLCEASFDFLMLHNHREVLGDFADRFGYEFPIRYDFLDTFDGGNLSLQCHPRPEYIHRNFGECFTQDETYYILDCKPDARVYLGFNANVDIEAFRRELEDSMQRRTAVNVENYVNTEPAHKHDLFLIPNGTIHCSGVNNLVLEISATPYIFTMKMYDWMRMDLNGEPRTLNIQRAFDNLYFERQGECVKKELISRPILISQGSDWKLFHLPTHAEHFYDVHRLEFSSVVDATTEGSPHVLNLVEGNAIILETASGWRQQFNYAETFIVPAATGSYRLINKSAAPAKVVKTFLKPDACPFAPPEGAHRQ